MVSVCDERVSRSDLDRLMLAVLSQLSTDLNRRGTNLLILIDLHPGSLQSLLSTLVLPPRITIKPPSTPVHSIQPRTHPLDPQRLPRDLAGRSRRGS